MKKQSLLAVVLALNLVFASCTTSDQQTTRTFQGSILGAALGAVIGHQSDNLVEGALIGAAVGGAIGYYIGGVETRTVRDAKTTEDMMKYSSSEGLKVNIASIKVEPADVKVGQEADLTTQIALAAPNRDKEYEVTQRVAIFRNGEQVGKTIEKTFAFKPGTHQISRAITFQDDAVPGDYQFVTHISVASGSEKDVDYQETNFKVL